MQFARHLPNIALFVFAWHRFLGSAGQSFGSFLTQGMNIRLVGEANDYVGKVCVGFAGTGLEYGNSFEVPMFMLFVVFLPGYGRRRASHCSQ